MTFRSFAEIYLGDMEPRLKRTTMQNKRYLIEHRVLPFFGDLPLNEITPAHVRKWQSQLLADKVAPTYAKTINNQLSAIFNYACKYYGLGINPPGSPVAWARKTPRRCLSGRWSSSTSLSPTSRSCPPGPACPCCSGLACG